jgi:small subunit ribosomal protein S16
LAVKLRLRRMGKKKQPIYKIVAADARSPRDGKFLEALGLYNPLTKPHTVDVKEDRILYWLSNGAQPTNTVKSLLREKGIILKNDLIKRGLDNEKIESELAEWQKLKEASAASKAKKKKISRKAKAKAEEPKDSAATEEPVKDKAEETPKKEEKIDESTAVETKDSVAEKPVEDKAEETPKKEEKIDESAAVEPKDSVAEEPIEDKAEKTPKKEKNIDESTAEVKGATSDEKEAEKEKE